MSKTYYFYKWWCEVVKGNFIDNDTLERIQNKLDYQPVKPQTNG